jgi:amidophosphoribosyltransferase
MEILMDKFRDECGVFGIFKHPDASNLTYLGLHALQHRGQEGAGIVTCDNGKMKSFKGIGLVGDIFAEGTLKDLAGQSAIGHVRYSTAGGSSLSNVQPFSVRYKSGEIALAHNGNLVNAKYLREQLEGKGSIFATNSDTEVILHLLASSPVHSFKMQLISALSQIEGAYSLVMLTDKCLVAIRDPHGFRPLVLGKKGDAYIVASETCALNLIGGKFIREVEPGEMLFINEKEVKSYFPLEKKPRKACIFEHIYFARPDSIIFGKSVYDQRIQLGRLLSRQHTVEADVVISVPDSGTAGAIGYSLESGIPFQMGLIRSHYVGRTFIEPSQKIRDFGVRLKLSPVKSILEGKKIVVVDDSIVRGTTSRKIVRMLREAGAKEVHLRITAPPTIASCFYGVDTPTETELIAHKMTVPEITKYLDADSLGYLSLTSLREIQNNEGFCEACFTKEYPI